MIMTARDVAIRDELTMPGIKAWLDSDWGEGAPLGAAGRPERPQPAGYERVSGNGAEVPARKGGGRYWIRTSDLTDVNRAL